MIEASCKNPQIFDPENLKSVAGRLQGVVLEAGDFEKVTLLAQKGDFVYFDPPYHPISRTSKFTSYTPDAFSPYDQERLKKVVELLAARAINSDASRRGRVNEVVVLNY